MILILNSLKLKYIFGGVRKHGLIAIFLTVSFFIQRTCVVLAGNKVGSRSEPIMGSANNNRRSHGREAEGDLHSQSPSAHLTSQKSNTHENPGDSNMIGSSDAFRSILETIQSVATRRCSITITGETGTGKEMVARKIHAFSDRKQNIFVPVDCTTLTGQLFESQLFGHIKGAFTGAIDDTLGFFRASNGGTIFLDEISEIPLELQAKLLRVLQEERVTPLGSTTSYPINVRVLCATNRDLRKMVENNEFRADLYYRVNVVNLQIPPLRERPEDILPLANHFLENLSRFYNEPGKILSHEAESVLLRYAWPGNVREMSNAMERAYVLSKETIILPQFLPPEILLGEFSSSKTPALPTLEAAEKHLVKQALQCTQGRKIAAAKILGIERRRLNRIIEKLNINVSQYKK